MNRSMIISKQAFYPQILQYSDVKSYLITAVFVALSVATPWAAHQIHLAGPTFLPMHYFVLMGGILFGWRAGLIIGLVSPVLSYSISGMPTIGILPQTTLEIATYGLVGGVLVEYAKCRSFWAIIGAMTAGRLVLLVAVSILGLFGAVQSPLGVETGSLQAVWSVVKQGWPGMLLQAISLPLLIPIIARVLNLNSTANAGN